MRKCRLRVFSPVSLSPPSDTLINDIPRDASGHQLHRDAQDLDVLISALVVEEQHLLVVYPTVPAYTLEMRRLAAGVNLQMIKVIDCAR